jgi:hypothetical protein
MWQFAQPFIEFTYPVRVSVRSGKVASMNQNVAVRNAYCAVQTMRMREANKPNHSIHSVNLRSRVSVYGLAVNFFEVFVY